MDNSETGIGAYDSHLITLTRLRRASPLNKKEAVLFFIQNNPVTPKQFSDLIKFVHGDLIAAKDRYGRVSFQSSYAQHGHPSSVGIIENQEDQDAMVAAYRKNNNVDAQSFVEIIASLSGMKSYQRKFINFLDTIPNLSASNFGIILLYLDKELQSTIATSYVESHPDLGVEDFREIIRYLDKESQSAISTSYVESHPNLSASDFRSILPYLDKELQSTIAKPYLESHSDLDVKDFIVILNSVDQESQPAIAKSYLESNPNLSVADFGSIITHVVKESQPAIAKSYLKSNPNLSGKDFIIILDDYADEESQPAIAKSYLESVPNPSGADFGSIIKYVVKELQSAIAKPYLESNPNLSASDFENILRYLDKESQPAIAKSYLESNPNLSVADFGNTLRYINKESQPTIFKSYFESISNLSVKDFKEITSYLDKESQSAIAKSYLESNPNLSVADYINNIIPHIEEQSKASLTKSFASRSNINLNEYLSDKLKDRSGNRYGKIDLLGFYINHCQDHISDETWVKLCNDQSGLTINLEVYQQLFAATRQSDAMVNAMNKLCISPAMRLEVLENITYSPIERETFKGIIASLEEDEEIFLTALEKIGPKISLSEAEKLTMLQGHNKAIYHNLAPLLSSKLNSESSVLKEGALESLQQIFGKDLAVEEVSLMDIFTYYEIFGSVQSFVDLLDPKFHETLKRDFKLSESKPYLFEREVAALNIITGVIHNLLSVANLTKYLNDKKAKINIPILSEEVINSYQLSFKDIEFVQIEEADSEAASEAVDEELSQQKKQLWLIEKQKVINEEFKAILRNPQNSLEEIQSFFSHFGEDYKSSINPADHQKILNLFNSNKQGIAYIFQRPEGLQQFLSEALFAGAGCLHNIGNKVSAIINSAMLDNVPEDVVLNGYFMNSIFFPIANSEKDLIGVQSSSLDHDKINKCKLNINGFFAVVKNDVEKDVENGGVIIKKGLNRRIDLILASPRGWIKDWVAPMPDDVKRRAISDLLVGIDDDLSNDYWEDSFNEGALIYAEQSFGDAQNFKDQRLGLLAMQVCGELFEQEPFKSNVEIKSIVAQAELCQQNILGLLEAEYIDVAKIKKDFVKTEEAREKEKLGQASPATELIGGNATKLGQDTVSLNL